MSELCSTAFDDDRNGLKRCRLRILMAQPMHWMQTEMAWDSNFTVNACSQPSGYVTDSTDCDDLSANAFPGAPDTCDGIDNDCNALVDEADSGLDTSTLSTFFSDSDNDGFGDTSNAVLSCEAPSGYVSDNTDCDDGNVDIYLGATETCNGLDDNCDGLVDNGAIDSQTWYADSDGDGFGNSSYGLDACSQPNGYVSDADDCDDNNADINPDSVWYIDLDGDGYGNSSFSTMRTATMSLTTPTVTISRPRPTLVPTRFVMELTTTVTTSMTTPDFDHQHQCLVCRYRQRWIWRLCQFNSVLQPAKWLCDQQHGL